MMAFCLPPDPWCRGASVCGGDTRQGRRRAVYVQGRRPLCGWVTPGGAASDSSGLGREMGQLEVVRCAGFKGREESTLPEFKRLFMGTRREDVCRTSGRG